jgi:hypothetical protein
MTFEEKVIDAFQLSSAALVKYEKQAKDQAEATAKVAELAPQVASELVRYGRIEASEKDACARALTDPVQCLQLMAKLAAHRSAAEEAALGQQVDQHGNAVAGNGHQKRANANYVGARTSEQPESWRRLAAGLGVG